jgi:hypothetical protein
VRRSGGRFQHPIDLRIPPHLSGWNKGNRALLASKQAYSLLAKFDHSENGQTPGVALAARPGKETCSIKIDLENAVKIEQGMPNPLGATWNGRGANFALFSAFPLEGAAPLA